MGKKKIRINFFSRLQSKKSTPPSLDGGILITELNKIAEDQKSEVITEKLKSKPDSEKFVFKPVKTEVEIDKRKKHRTIMVIGQIGTGKTALLNSMVNYLWNVNYNDKYRYKLESAASPVSQTDNVKTYHLESMKLDYQLSVIDTPGFGSDKIGESNMQKIENFLKHNHKNIDAVYLVIKSSDQKEYKYNKLKYHHLKMVELIFSTEVD